MPFLVVLLLFIIGIGTPAWSDPPAATPQPARFVESYTGGYKDAYPDEQGRVQTYILSVQSDIATQLGLQYGQGFLHPVTIRFTDGAPTVSENPYFYTQSKGSEDTFSQELVANVEAFAKHRDELTQQDDALRNSFRYALTQVMLNDLAAGDPEKALPLWVQEGIAVYASGSGERFVQEAGERAAQTGLSPIQDLDSPGPYLTPKEWAGYYLAVKYIFATGGVGALQAFVRNMADGESAADAVRGALGQEWPAFSAALHDYTVATFNAVSANVSSGTAPAADDSHPQE